jgi:hypothetical protein
VRRGLVREASKAAFALVDAAPADALRRAAIICLEDAVLHPQLPLVVWLMVAQSKGYCLSLDHIAAVVKMYGDLASCPGHDIAIFEADEEKGVPSVAECCMMLYSGRAIFLPPG